MTNQTDDEEVVAGFFNSLMKPKEPALRLMTPVLVWFLAGAGVFFGVAGVLLLGWNLLIPLFDGPLATYPEAIGATIFLGLGFLAAYLLKEGKA